MDTAPGCAWTVASDVPWIQAAAAGGTGSGVIPYTVLAAGQFSPELRQGRLRVRWNTPTAGQDVLITQTIRTCDALIAPPTGPTSSETFGASAGAGQVVVEASFPANRPWVFASAPAWITFTSPPLGVLGSGNGSARFIVSANPGGASRQGTIAFCNGQTMTVKQTGRSRVGPYVPGDFDDDGIADLAVYRPSTGTWFVLRSTSGYAYSGYFQLQAPAGQENHLPTLGDFDGDARTDFAGNRGFLWFTRYSSDSYGSSTTTFAQVSTYPNFSPDPADVPVTMDTNGDGKSDFAIFRPSIGTWYSRVASEGDPRVPTRVTPVQWGLPGDVPVPGDFDGDGKADFAVWRPSTGTWFTLLSVLNDNPAAPMVFQWGLPGDVPISGADFDRDGRADPAIWRPSDGTWWVLYSSTWYTTWQTYQWGLPGDIPVANDYDGDRITDLAVWRPSNGIWYILPSSSHYSYGAARFYQWGLPGDIPIKR